MEKIRYISLGERQYLLRYGAAVLIILATSIFFFYIDKGSPFLVMLGGILISAFIGSFGAGVIATILATIIMLYLFFLPSHAYSLNNLEIEDIEKLAIFIVLGLLISVLGFLKKRAENLLNLERDFAKTIVNTLQEPLIILNEKQEVISANPSFYNFFKLSKEEVEKHLFQQLKSGFFEIPKLKKILKKIVRKSNSFSNFEVEHTFPNIGCKTLIFNISSIDRGNKKNILLLTIENITKIKDLEKQRDTFIAITTHEVKTPVTVIKGFAELLQKKLEGTRDLKALYFANNIVKHVDNLTNLTNDLIDVSKISVGKLAYCMEKTELSEVIKKITTDFKYSQYTHHIMYEGKIKSKVFVDKERISQVLANLISNAIKYSPKANNVIVTANEDKKMITIGVKDYGIGIAKQHQRKIFSRFYRVGSFNGKRIEGTGLGLYISKEIIKRHGGRLWAKSKPNAGSTFYFTLPLKKRV